MTNQFQNFRLAKYNDVVIPAPTLAEFEYASTIRTGPWPGPGEEDGFGFEVDIKNIGAASGTCHPTAHIRTNKGHDYPSMGTEEINPGEVVTFYGKWHWRYSGEPNWLDKISIRSEAGLISFAFDFDLQFVSYEPTEVGSGIVFTPVMTLLLPYRSGYAYECRLSIDRTRVIHCLIGAPDFTYNPKDRTMHETGIYIFTGVPITAIAGVYEVITWVMGYGNAGRPTWAFYNDPVGQIKVL